MFKEPERYRGLGGLSRRERWELAEVVTWLALIILGVALDVTTGYQGLFFGATIAGGFRILMILERSQKGAGK